MSVYHAGEIEVQKLAGVVSVAEQNGRSIRNHLPRVAADFLQRQSFIIAGSVDAKGRVWASILTGLPGFIEVLNEQTIRITSRPVDQDPMLTNLSASTEIGLLAIELPTRRRMRLNGTASFTSEGITIQTEQVYSNCPKYIQAREHSPDQLEKRKTSHHSTSDAMNDSQIKRIQNADTFFIASASEDYKVDASHRGGSPGFILVEDHKTLVFPDYFGNSMFNTLGNIHANPNCGLLFIDFETGDTLQLTGKGVIVWDEEEISHFPAADRLVRFEVDECIEIRNANPISWTLLGYSPHNPTL